MESSFPSDDLFSLLSFEQKRALFCSSDCLYNNYQQTHKAYLDILDVFPKLGFPGPLPTDAQYCVHENKESDALFVEKYHSKTTSFYHNNHNMFPYRSSPIFGNCCWRHMLKTSNSTTGSDSFYKKQIEQLTKEKKQLKERLELLETENHDLRRSVFELSVSKASKEQVLDLDAALIPTNHGDYRTNTSLEGYLHNMEWDWREPGKGESGSFSKFGWKFDLAGHLGAVYVVEFSKCGRWIASGSQDKSLRIWQLDKPSEPVSLLMDAHASSISDLCWNSDSTNIATCGYDRQVKEWSLEEGATLKCLNCYSLPGLVQDVEYGCVGQPPLLVASTSQGSIHILDRRTQQSNWSIITNDCSVNSIYVHDDGILLTSGDHRGHIKRWDIRNSSKPLEVFYNSKRPISHLEVSRPREEEGQYLAVTSFDNTIRVYDRGGYLLGSSFGDSLKLLHTLKGIKSQNWPIRCSFYQGADFLKFKSGSTSLETREANPLSSNTSIPVNNALVNNTTSNMHSIVPLTNYRPQETLTLASGSADGNIYIYDVGQPEGTACFVQCCHGHSDRVYGVCFHPTEPIFASCSADAVVKIWGPVKSKSHW